MFLLRACMSSDVQAVSSGTWPTQLSEFGFATADILHFKNFSFQRSILHLKAEAEVWSPTWECDY